MPQDHHLQAQRFELKYMIDDALTPAIRDFVACYLELDEYTAGSSDYSYPVHSVYLDSDDLKIYGDWLIGAKNRYKLRLRYYNDRPDSPVFFEIKARVDNCCLKQRCPVRREAVPLLLSGHLPEPQHVMSKEPRHLASLQRFVHLAHRLQAAPKAHNYYRREAWVPSDGTSVRVTMDRQVQIEPWFKREAVVNMTKSSFVFGKSVVLELKFTERFPTWLHELVSTFNLMQFASAKYASGVLAMGESCFHNGEFTFDWETRAPVNCVERRPASEGERLPLPGISEGLAFP